MQVAAPAFHTDRNCLPGAPYPEGKGSDNAQRPLSRKCPCPGACSDPLLVSQSPRRVAGLLLLAKLRRWHRGCSRKQSSALGSQVSPCTGHTAPWPIPGALGDKQACSARGFPYLGTTSPSLELPAMQLQLGERGKAPTSATPDEPTWQNL